ncbi:conserved hypothetical protein [Parvibaculum lavamentivorans DS-1]|uniref:DUF3035 domain-containing protein n=1 Tax=Parvibaculum lavamentivorans (strain DS-1 / DSM 13023 / NCIMB 13966) TaxID=402881 RepID=A7HPS9_PARL1|nr:DUF3035 domain-containing protein [Parvibaculum lavamentivorans]ABS61912.1 conserved hypothetical protein [Parvibaculum lavamentivorans DS-1]
MNIEANISRVAGWGAKAGLFAALSVSLAACGGESLRDTLGYGKSAPDEFAIVTKAPLVIPPDYSLRPPQPGAPRPQEMEIQPSIGAQRALMGDASVASSGSSTLSAGEQALLSQSGGAEADPRIRQVVNAETRSLVEEDKTFVDNVIFWKQPGTPPDERLVNPTEETQRIQQNEAEGKPVTEGETPTVKQKKEGWFSGIF